MGEFIIGSTINPLIDIFFILIDCLLDIIELVRKNSVYLLMGEEEVELSTSQLANLYESHASHELVTQYTISLLSNFGISKNVQTVHCFAISCDVSSSTSTSLHFSFEYIPESMTHIARHSLQSSDHIISKFS